MKSTLLMILETNFAEGKKYQCFDLRTERWYSAGTVKYVASAEMVLDFFIQNPKLF